jgi:hypothetical protein
VQGALRVRLKGKVGDLGGARSGKAGEDHGGRCAAGGARRKKGKEEGHCRAGPSCQRERENAWRRRPCELGRAGLRAGRRRRTERELSGPARGKKGGPRGRRPA